MNAFHVVLAVEGAAFFTIIVVIPVMEAFGNALNFVFFMIPWLLVLGGYCAVGGAVYSRSRAYLDRFTDMPRDSAKGLAVAAGAGWPIAVPWFLLAQLTGNIEPHVRAEKSAILRQEALEREAREATLRTAAENARFNEELALRKRMRLVEGQEIPYVKEELLALESEETKVRLAKAQADKQEIEAEHARTQLDIYRSKGY